MSNQEEKKCECHRLEFTKSGSFCDYCKAKPEEKKCETYTDRALRYDRERREMLAKPSPSQSCEHDKGDHWDSNINYSGFATVRKYERNKCPYCKPTAVEPLGNPDIGYGWVTLCSNPHKAVEPSWESIDRKEAEKIDRAILDAIPVEPSVESIAEEIVNRFKADGRIYDEGFGEIIDAIADALRNERNRHG